MKLFVVVCLLACAAVVNAACPDPETFTCGSENVQRAPVLNVTYPKSSVITPGIFNVTIASTLLYSNTTIQFDVDTPTANRTSFCDYNLWQCSPYWQPIIAPNGCDVEFFASFPDVKKVLRECFHRLGINVTGNDGYDVYESNIRVTSYRDGITVRGISNATKYVNLLKLRMRFPIYVNVSIDKKTAVYGDPYTVESVVSQTFDQVQLTTTIILKSTINPPYILNTPPAVTLAPDAGIASNLFSYTIEQITPAGDCPNDNSSICLQTWKLVLSPIGGQCQYRTGVTLDYTINCRQLAIDGNFCSLYTPNTYSINWNVLSNDFCIQVIDSGALTGTLVPYSDPQLTVVQPTFLYGQRAYLKASVFYAFGPTIVATAITRVDILSSQLITFAPTDIAAGFRVNNSVSASEVSITFICSPAIITLTNPDEYQPVNITVYLTITYSIAPNDIRTKEHKLQFATQATQSASTVGTVINVKSDTATNAANSSGTVSVIIPVAASIGSFVAIVALVVLLRRSYFKSELANEEAPAAPKEVEAQPSSGSGEEEENPSP